MSLDPAAVMALALEWVYVPETAREVRTERFHLVAYPPTWATPTAAFRLDADGSPAALVEEVLAAAAGLGRDDVTFWTHPDTRPAGLVAELLARGAVLDEELAVMARELGRGPGELPDLDVPDGLEVRLADDLATSRDADRVGVAVFGGSESDDAELAAALRTSSPATGLTWVAYRDDRPVGSAGATIRGGVLRLWGGGVLPETRGTGVYRALLDHRLRVGVEAGCTLALVTGRLETSAPVLRRASFVACGEECSHRLRAGG